MPEIGKKRTEAFRQNVYLQNNPIGKPSEKAKIGERSQCMPLMHFLDPHNRPMQS